MNKIIVATQNKGKVTEIKKLLEGLPIEVLTMGEAHLDIDIEENGQTFEENAKIKAEAISKLTDAFVLADDSGLEIDYLGKEPGIYSARYLGKDTPYREKNQVILERLQDVPKEKRTARFICAMALAQKGEKTVTTIGIMEGYIGYQIEGTNGFGYDPIFFIDELGTSTASISLEEKNKRSHRAKALKEMLKIIKERLDTI